jgi:hypothetical protein
MTQRTMWATATIVSVLIVGMVGVAGQSAKIDVTGVWAFTVESALGTGTPTVTLKQQGEKLTGHYSSQLVGEADLAGTVKGQTIEFTVTAALEGMQVELKYTGTVDTKDSMKGKVSAAELGDGTFTAKRK